MDSDRKSVGVVESAVRAYHPTPAVLFEAGALDREIKNPERSWEALLRAVESFATHYPAVLLKSPDAMMELGRTCLQGVREAPGEALRTRAAALLEELLSGVAGEVIREGAEGVERRVPEGMRSLLEELRPGPGVERQPGHLLPPLQALGRKVLLAAEDSSEPGVWYGLLDVLTGLLLGMISKQVEGEPAYDGRWDHSKAADMLEVDGLDAVRRERMEADLAWLAELEKDLLDGQRPGVDVFLELSAYQKRDEREAAWETWFQAVAAKSLSGELSAGMLRKLCMGVAEQIDRTRDRRFLAKLATIVSRVVPRVAAANGEAGLRTALDTFGKAIVLRLEREAGRGDPDEIFLDLSAGVGELVQRLLDRAGYAETGEALDLGLRVSTGPLTGHPVGREDVIWRLSVAARHPQVAEKLLSSLLSGFSLEDMLLRDDRRPGGVERSVGEVLADLLGRSWGPRLRHLVRAVIRVAPLSPFHVGGATTRAHLLALDPEERQDSYLHDLKEQVLSRAGPGNVAGVESVLNFWLTGEAAHLDGMVSPESLTALPAQTRDGHLEHIRRLMEDLGRHVPVEPGQTKSGVRWLAGMPEALYDAGTIVKVAGFPGCSSKAVALLSHLLQLYRDLVEKYQRAAGAPPSVGAEPDDLLEHSGRLLRRREELLKGLFAEGGLEELEPVQRLELFNRELAVVREEDGCLEELANRSVGVLDRDRLPRAEKVLGHMLMHACLSGLGTGELEIAAASLAEGRLVEPELFQLLGRVAWQVAAVRNRLAESLQPHVEDSVRRLLSNPLSRPAAAYRGLFEYHRSQGAERLALEMGDKLLEDLLSADGSFLLLEDFAHRMMHAIERY
jgi:hypothetical protein